MLLSQMASMPSGSPTRIISRGDSILLDFNVICVYLCIMYKYWKNLANLSYGYIVYCMGIYIAVDVGSCDMERLNNSGINKIEGP